MKAAIFTLPSYEKRAGKLLSPAEKTALEDHIAEAPEAHPMVPGTGGVRAIHKSAKIVARLKGRVLD